MVVNDVASVYGLEGITGREKVSPERLEYVRNEEGLATSTTPNLLKLAGVVQKARDLGVNIKTEADVVKQFGSLTTSDNLGGLMYFDYTALGAGVYFNIVMSYVDSSGLMNNRIPRMLNVPDRRAKQIHLSIVIGGWPVTRRA